MKELLVRKLVCKLVCFSQCVGFLLLLRRGWRLLQCYFFFNLACNAAQFDDTFFFSFFVSVVVVTVVTGVGFVVVVVDEVGGDIDGDTVEVEASG